MDICCVLRIENMAGKKELTIVESGDHSHTLYVPELDEHYHSHKGAVQESEHVFMKAGLEKALERFSIIKIVEIGFGTGLNAALTLVHTKNINNCSIEYHAYENFPLGLELITKLNYDKIIGIDTSSFLKMHESDWECYKSITNKFTIVKHRQDLVSNVRFTSCNLVYFDAFAPQKQPDMWSSKIFEALYNSMEKMGVLVTYSAMGEVRRKLSSVGFKVERLPGPPGKREMLRAIK